MASLYDEITRHPALWMPLIVFAVLLAGLIYFSPTLIGLVRQVERPWALFAVNWVFMPVALGFAFALPSKRTRTRQNRVRPAMAEGVTWPFPGRSTS